ncbi:MAG: Crp/Fnr family transcriptional regulator [Candidatus Methanomethylicaceae archaeon]
MNVIYSDKLKCPQCKCILSSFNEIHRNDLLHFARFLFYQVGQTIFQQGEPANHIYMCCSGHLKIAQRTEHGHIRIIRFVHEGQLFGEEALLNTHQLYMGFAEAMTPSLVCWLPASVVINILQSSPNLSLELIKQLIWHINELRESLMVTNFMISKDRVEQGILHLCRRYGSETLHGIEIGIEFKESELAQLIGLPLETTSRYLSSWKRQGWIIRKGRRWIIPHDSPIIKLK